MRCNHHISVVNWLTKKRNFSTSSANHWHTFHLHSKRSSRTYLERWKQYISIVRWLTKKRKFQLLKQRTATHSTNICFHFFLKRWLWQKDVYDIKCCALAYKGLKHLQQHTRTHFTLPWLQFFVVLVVWRMDERKIGYLSYQKLLIQVALRYHVENVITI